MQENKINFINRKYTKEELRKMERQTNLILGVAFFIGVSIILTYLLSTHAENVMQSLADFGLKYFFDWEI